MQPQTTHCGQPMLSNISQEKTGVKSMQVVLDKPHRSLHAGGRSDEFAARRDRIKRRIGPWCRPGGRPGGGGLRRLQPSRTAAMAGMAALAGMAMAGAVLGCFGEFFGCLPRVILAVCPTPTCAWTWDLHPTSLCAADGGRSTTQNNANPPRGQTNPAINACKSYVRVRPWQ